MRYSQVTRYDFLVKMYPNKCADISQVMLLVNKSVGQGLVNGSKGIVVGFSGEESKEEAIREAVTRGDKSSYLCAEGKENLEMTMV